LRPGIQVQPGQHIGIVFPLRNCKTAEPTPLPMAPRNLFFAAWKRAIWCPAGGQSPPSLHACHKLSAVPAELSVPEWNPNNMQTE
jgi:hypothetical protein